MKKREKKNKRVSTLLCFLELKAADKDVAFNVAIRNATEASVTRFIGKTNTLVMNVILIALFIYMEYFILFILES